MADVTKRCATCKVEKPWSEFYVVKKRKPTYNDRPSSACRTCTQSNAKARFASEAEYRAYSVKMRARTKYGVGEELFEAIKHKLSGTCEICGRVEDSTHRGRAQNLSIDHNHQTGAFRGLLCKRHNRGLGFFQDSPQLLKQAAAYLEPVGSDAHLWRLLKEGA